MTDSAPDTRDRTDQADPPALTAWAGTAPRWAASLSGVLRWRVRQVEAAMEASRREVDAPLELSNREREAWADGYTKACEDIREAVWVASDAT